MVYNVIPGSPGLIVFEGWVYSRMSTPVSQVDISEVGFVVATTPQIFEEPDPERRGLKILVFNNAVYFLTNSKPYHVEEELQWTVMAPGISMPSPSPHLQLAHEIVRRHDIDRAQSVVPDPVLQLALPSPPPQMTPAARQIARSSPSPQMAPAACQVDHSSPSPQMTPTAREVTRPSPPPRMAPETRQVARPTPAPRKRTAPRAIPNQASAPPRTLAMPPRALVKDNTPLTYGFDLWNVPAATVANMEFNIPLKSNGDYQALRGTLPATPGFRWYGWPDEPVRYLWELVEIGMLLKNRELFYSDFVYVTEALHRRYSGTMVDGKIFIERGYHNVHSKVVKDLEYKQFVACFLQ
ncbi:hypothetical protein ACEPPN_000159 [Leptodophora sp. 'Broadleaf-Isolate-01']